jgi:hypothetical protein
LVREFPCRRIRRSPADVARISEPAAAPGHFGVQWRNVSVESFESERAANKTADSHDEHSRFWVTVPEASKLVEFSHSSYATNDACLFSQYSSAISAVGECLRAHVRHANTHRADAISPQPAQACQRIFQVALARKVNQQYV